MCLNVVELYQIKFSSLRSLGILLANVSLKVHLHVRFWCAFRTQCVDSDPENPLESSITKISIMTFSIMDFFATLSIYKFQHNHWDPLWWVSLCWVLHSLIAMMNADMLSLCWVSLYRMSLYWMSWRRVWSILSVISEFKNGF